MASKHAPEMVPIHEASSRTGLSYYFIRQLCLQDEIVYVKAGNKYLINFDRFIDYLNGGNTHD
jgi:excisionase family DNA binding protein